jgi:putative membrane-bound dehydrogenase-like protein
MKLASFLLSSLLLAAIVASGADGPLMQIGAARIDITPEYPVRLHGYGGRRTNSQGVAQHLFAKAIAFGSDREGPSILFTVDNLAVTGAVTDEVAARLKKRARISREQVALCSSHTHSAPMLTDAAPNIFSSDIIPEQQAAIDRYTRELVDNLERVALAALNNRAPSKLSWSEGTVKFAKNRRVIRDGRAQFGENETAPVDHTLATMFVHGADGKLRAVLANYACHCTTLGGEWNQIHGDWSGYAQAALERDHPGTVALISIGCGADANPSPRGKLENAQAHGDEIAAEVRRLLTLPAKPLTKLPDGKLKRIQLDFDPLPTRAQWEERATKAGIIGYHAKKNLARLDHGEKLPTRLPYVVQSWIFDDQLGMVFLAGEVVVDYQRRLKNEFDNTRLWVNGYANDVPCYIPSRRILTEGGYEAEDSLWYYDRPARLAMSSENRIVEAVHDLVPKKFAAKTKRAEASQPLSPKAALNSMRVAPEFKVDLVVAEPHVIDPVAIDWGADGKLWVVEMRDYPMGIDGKWKPGGCVKFLEDRNGDGRYEKASLFLDNLPFPTGVFAWRKGVLVCAAPDILYAEDTNGDGRADVVKKLFTGFATNNYQARVNSLSLGLDNWIYGANGLLGGTIRFVGGTGSASPILNGDSRSSSLQGELDIRGRDFRMNPDTGAFEPASGLTQQGRVRDDFGNWFGCDNTHLLWHYPLGDEYVRRNQGATPPAPNVQVPQGREWNWIFPASQTLERFNDPNSANRVTSACGLEIYRDELLGKEFYGHAFTCEPVHNLVHREVLMPDGVTFRSTRATNEPDREFLASTDNWFRPVQARAGPDGALWIVDMYRYVIEHPRWIPSNRLAQLDVRAGDDKGRIYRVYRKDSPPRPIRNFAKFSPPQLAAALDSPNGTERDIVHRELLNRGDKSATVKLNELATNGSRSAVRVQALAALDGLDAMPAELLAKAFHDSSPDVRRMAARLSRSSPLLTAALRDENAQVRWQAALALLGTPELGTNVSLVPEAATNKWMRWAISATPQRRPLIEAALRLPERGNFALLETLILGPLDSRDLQFVLGNILPQNAEQLEAWRFRTATKLVQSRTLSSFDFPKGTFPKEPWTALANATSLARAVATNKTADVELRTNAVLFLGQFFERNETAFFAPLLREPPMQQAAIDSLLGTRSRFGKSEVNHRELAAELLAVWRSFSLKQREQVAAYCVSRPETADVLLHAVQQSAIAPAEISASLQDRLLKSSTAVVREAAVSIWGKRNSDRTALIANYRTSINSSGKSERGAEVFEKVCATCHALNGRDHAVGPDLAPLRDKSAEDFLVAVLDPNAAIEPRFVSYNVETKDGRALSGVIRSETAGGFTLVQGGGIEQTLFRNDVTNIVASSISLMPEGLEQGITPAQMNDLIAFLKQPAVRAENR